MNTNLPRSVSRSLGESVFVAIFSVDKNQEVHEEPVLSFMTEGALEPLVTSNLTGLTYKNLYCGLCNYESSEKLEAWSWNFDCKLHFPTVNASGTTLIDKAR